MPFLRRPSCEPSSLASSIFEGAIGLTGCFGVLRTFGYLTPGWHVEFERGAVLLRRNPGCCSLLGVAILLLFSSSSRILLSNVYFSSDTLSNNIWFRT